jgi:asparagine synthase (glutamine-hydrolysing)
MCGIVGFTGTPQPEVLGRAMATIAHRGPDADGRHEDPFVSLGHCRLSIIDLATGGQPMHSDDGRFVLAFNGEIYNFRELRTELEGKGYRFRTSSDTEVLLYWLVCHWRDRLADLNGMFAFACWDRQEKRLLLARDRLGIKPLYVHERNGRLVFASEVKAIAAIAAVREPDLPAIFQFVTFQNVLSDATFFKDVRKLSPGAWHEWSPGRALSGRFWNLAFRHRFNGNFRAVTTTYRETLERSVTRHMISDVPVGTYLSGGIDSASVSVVAARHTPCRMHAFTGAFVDSPYYDERPGSRAVAAQAAFDLHEVEIRPEDFCDNLGRVVYHLDEPTLGTGALPQFMVSKLAARHVKVVLTGHGGDEAFGGYQVSKAALLRDLAPRRPLRALRHLAGVRRDELSRVLYFSLYPLLHPEVGNGLFIMTPTRARARQLSADFLSAVDGYEPLDEVRALVEPGMSRSEMLQALYLRAYLPTLFIQEDKVGMAHSLEARMPLCDNELIDLALGIDLETKLHGGELKAIPRAAMRGELPDVLYTLPKRGFPTPFARWFRAGRARDLMADLLLSPRARSRGIFRPEYVAELFRANERSRTDTLFDYARANALYSMGVVELWFRTFVDRAAPQPVG